jgi:hypothetical protein
VTDTHGPRVPRRSAQVVQSSVRAHHASQRKRSNRRAFLGLLFVVLAVWGANALIVGRPIRDALAADSGTARLQLRARFQYHLDFTTLVLDLGSVDSAAPENALGGLLVAARTMRAASRSFRRVVLAHGRDAVFVLSGEDFTTLGAELTPGRNIVALVRSVPQKLRGAAGASGFGPWQRPLPPLLGPEAGDAAAVARSWASGGPP